MLTVHHSSARLRTLLLFFLLLFVSCSTDPTDETSHVSLSITVCAEEVIQDLYPLQVLVRTSDAGNIKGSSVLQSSGQTTSFDLPTWMRYQVIVKAQSGAFASTEVIVRDQPVTLCLMLTEDGHAGSEGDTIHISLDDSTWITPLIDRPQAISLYKGHVVALSDSISPDSASLTLLSLHQWSGLAAATSTTDSLTALQNASGYREMELSEWRMPSVDEAKRIKTAYASGTQAFDSLNRLLSQQGADPIVLQGKDGNARYLCDEGRKTYSFVSGSTIVNAGKKVNDYYMRLVCTLRIKVKR